MDEFGPGWNAVHDDDPEEWLEPEDLTDEELGRNDPPDPVAIAAARRRNAEARQRWRYLADTPLPEQVHPAPEDLGAVLRAVRWHGDLSQRQLALASGVSHATVGRLEAAGGDVRLSTLLRFVEAVGLRLAVVDEEGTQLAVPFEQEMLRDGGDRRLPAHLQTIDPRFRRWWGASRHQVRGRRIRTPPHASRGRAPLRRPREERGA